MSTTLNCPNGHAGPWRYVERSFCTQLTAVGFSVATIDGDTITIDYPPVDDWEVGDPCDYELCDRYIECTVCAEEVELPETVRTIDKHA